MPSFYTPTLDMRGSSIRGATQLASVSGSRVTNTVQHHRNNVQSPVECIATTSGVKLPATHLQASQAALQQLQSNKGLNREYLNAFNHTSVAAMIFRGRIAGFISSWLTFATIYVA